MADTGTGTITGISGDYIMVRPDGATTAVPCIIDVATAQALTGVVDPTGIRVTVTLRTPRPPVITSIAALPGA